MIADSVPNFPIVKETVLWFWSHSQVHFSSVNTTSNDLLRADVEKNLQYFFIVFIFRIVLKGHIINNSSNLVHLVNKWYIIMQLLPIPVFSLLKFWTATFLFEEAMNCFIISSVRKIVLFGQKQTWLLWSHKSILRLWCQFNTMHWYSSK